MIGILPVAIYFYVGGMYWEQIFIPSLILPFISTFASFFLVESPRYLFAREMYPELRKNIATFAKVNKVRMSENYIIEGEVQPTPQMLNSGGKYSRFIVSNPKPAI